MFQTIRMKLLASFVFVILLISTFGITVYQISQANNALVADAIDKDFNGSVAIATLAVEAQKNRRFEKEYFIYVEDAEKAKKYAKEWTDTYTS